MKNKRLETIKKVLAKADPKSKNYEAEMDVALKMAKKLMAKYKITMSEVDAFNIDKDPSFEEGLAHTGSLEPWKEWLMSVITKLTGTQAIVQQTKRDETKRLIIIGSEESVAMAISLFNVLRKTIPERARVKFPVELFGHRIHRSYLEGFVTNLQKRAEEKVIMDTVGDQEKYDLMVINEGRALTEYVNKKHDPKTPPPPIHDVNSIAYTEGFNDAENESLSIHRELE